MGSEIAINVEVTISDELRSLLALMTRQVWAWDPEEPRAVARSQDDGAKDDGPNQGSGPAWQEIWLRRDGQRPLAFQGLPVFTRYCLSDGASDGAEQRLSLYLAQDGAFYAQLSFAPPETAAARPSHRCQRIHDPDEFERFVRAWQPESCFENAFATDGKPQEQQTAGRLAVRSAFNSMAADCLNTAVLQA